MEVGSWHCYPHLVRPQIFLLSPANCSGQRARIVMSERATFDLALRLRANDGAPLGDVFSFLSGLYFRGKLAYARAFARPADPTSDVSGAGVFIITPSAGLRTPETPITLSGIRGFAKVEVAIDNPTYRRPYASIGSEPSNLKKSLILSSSNDVTLKLTSLTTLL